MNIKADKVAKQLLGHVLLSRETPLLQNHTKGQFYLKQILSVTLELLGTGLKIAGTTPRVDKMVQLPFWCWQIS